MPFNNTFNPPSSRVGAVPPRQPTTTTTSPRAAAAAAPPPRSHVRPRPTAASSSSAGSSSSCSPNGSCSASATGGSPIWVRTSVLEHCLHRRAHSSSRRSDNDDAGSLASAGGGAAGAGAPGAGAAAAAAARRKFGWNKRFSPGGAGDNTAGAGDGGRSEDWGWVRGWAVQCSSASPANGGNGYGGEQQTSAGSSILGGNDGHGTDRQSASRRAAASAAAAAPNEDASSGPVSPFGHVKLRRVGSAASPRFANEQSQQRQQQQQQKQKQQSQQQRSQQSFAHRSNSSPIPSSAHDSRRRQQQRQRQNQEEEDEKKPIQAVVVTIHDKDYPMYNGQTFTIDPEHVQDGTAPANNWWTMSSCTNQNQDQNRRRQQQSMPPDDLIELTHLHEPAVVHCLRTRYGRGTVYTHTGPILLACNPFRTLRGLYSEDAMKRYWEQAGGGIAGVGGGGGNGNGGGVGGGNGGNGGGAEEGDGRRLPPHVYGLADDAFRAMMRAFEDGHGAGSAPDGATNVPFFADQSILVSGESGAGKTVTTKFVMRYLATLSQRCASTTAPTAATSAGREGGIEQQVLQSNPILESFGNARTIRNDNSSRFGKFIEMQFMRSGTLTAANIDTYLLEKVRLITQSPGERNFHILYEILADGGGDGADDKTALGLRHATPEDFAMTSASGTYDRRDGVNDIDTYQDLKNAMITVGFTAEERLDILSVPAALLFCSNLTFLDGESHDGSSELDGDNPSLPNALHLLGVTGDALNDAICTSTIEVAGETLRKVLSRDQATKALEAFMMATYGALFRYIVEQVNSSITVGAMNGASSSDDTAFISVLDIFGFESFKTNSFEQLCINYCNEALQQQFNRFVFKLEQQEYEREGIEWSFIEFPDNQEVLDLIEKKHTGIISILDEQCRLTKCTDQTFVSKTYETCGDHPRFIGSDREKARGCFSVHHYAGPVEYNSESFLAKNKDELPKETTDLLLSSSRPLLCELGEMLSALSPMSPSTSADGNRFAKRSSSSLSRASVGSQFSSQLKQLRERIEQTAPHYVRCLKPNDELVPDNFVPAIIADQLRCAGVLEAVRVSRVGFPQRYAHSLFVQRYGMLGGHAFESARRRQRHDLCYVLVDAIVPQIWNYHRGHVPADDRGEEFAHDYLSVGVQIGKTKVFLRQRAFEALEQLRAEKLDRAATKIQASVRMFLCRDSFMFILESAIMIQAVFRGYMARRFVDTVRHYYLATIIQTAWRRFIAFDDYRYARFIAIWCQRVYRGRAGRRYYALVREHYKAIVLQSFWRMCNPYRRFCATVCLVLNLQRLFRSWRARSVLKQLKLEARNLDHVAQERDELRREALRVKQELEDLKRRRREDERLLQASDSNSVEHGGLSSVASSQVSIVYRDFPKTPTAQEEEIRALANACTAKDLEMERLRQELESIKEEKGNDVEGPPIKTIFANHKHITSEENSSRDTPAATEAESAETTPSSGGLNGSPQKPPPSKRGLMMGRLDLLMGRQDNNTGAEAAGSIVSGTLRQSKMTSISLLDNSDANDKSYMSDSPRKYSIQRCGSREMMAYAPALLNSSYSDDFEESPLHHAIRSSDVGSLSEFIDSCEDIYAYVNEGGRKGRTALHLAVLNGSLKMTSILLQHYAVPNLQDNAGNTPLHYAEDPTMMELLLAKGGANPNIPNGDGLCALHLAVRRKDVDAVRHLLAHRADVTVADDIRWCTALHLVAQFDNFSREYPQNRSSPSLSPSGEIAHMLCGAIEPSEADLNYQDRDGNTPLHHAAVVKNDCAREIIAIFLGHGSDPNIKNERGQTPTHLICHNNSQRHLGTYRGLIDNFLSFGTDPNLPSFSGCTPLHLCLYHRDIDSAVRLLHAGGQLHLPWKKPEKWKAYWAETGLREVYCTDMITNQADLRLILSAITTKQETPPLRPNCMRCMSSFGQFGKRYYCAHCSSLVCRSCSTANVDSTELPAFCRDSDSLMVCTMCEDIVLSRLGNDY